MLVISTTDDVQYKIAAGTAKRSATPYQGARQLIRSPLFLLPFRSLNGTRPGPQGGDQHHSISDPTNHRAVAGFSAFRPLSSRAT